MTNEEAMRGFLHAVWDQRDLAAIEHWVSADAVCHGLADDGADIVGPEHFRHYVESFQQAFTRVQLDVEDIMSSGERVAARIQLSLIHESGKELSCVGVCWFVFRDGLLVEGWNFFDLTAMMAQLS